MYAVIFRARANKLDQEYSDTAERLRQLALSEYKCIDFISFTEGKEEVAISWWHSMDDIKAWKNNGDHKAAQEKGRALWYESVDVQIVEVLNRYQ